MATTYVTFDMRSGRILSVHHGATDADEALRDAQYQAQYQAKYQPQYDAKTSDEQVEVIAVPSDAVEQGKQYKVDVKSKTLVTTEGNDGVGFGFGSTNRSY